MDWDTMMRFLTEMLQKMRLQLLMLSPTQPLPIQVDACIRHRLRREREYEHLAGQLQDLLGKPVLCKTVDPYRCRYLIVSVPRQHPSELIIIGPYQTYELSREQLLTLGQRYSLPTHSIDKLEQCYKNVPLFRNEAALFAVVSTFAELAFGGKDNFELIESDMAESMPHWQASSQDTNADLDDTLLRMELVEKRYAAENRLMETVSKGQRFQLTQVMPDYAELPLDKRLDDTLRNAKNYFIIFNTILRKAAEKGGVHPFYLDRISGSFARRIEVLLSTDEGPRLLQEMLDEYCRLVRKNTTLHCSAMVRRTLIFVDANLANDINLSVIATHLQINACYLSSCFHKETGETISMCINRKRVEHAAYLLKQTHLQIQTIAQYCGFADANYFSKVFRRFTGLSPSQHRSSPAQM